MGDAMDDFTAGGYLLESGYFSPCTVVRSGGRVEIDPGLPDRCDFKAVFIKDMVNAHTHCADYGLKVPAGLSLEELVAPPDGLKHRYLSELGMDGLKDNIRRFDSASAQHGSASFMDFREGGAPGCRALRECSRDALILGRPVSKEYDPGEIEEILSVADGIGISSISDMDMDYIESVADDVRRANKIFAIHASERVREDIDAILSLDPAFVVHMCEATDSDLAKCAEAEVPIAVCPTSNSYFGKTSPVARMLNNGVDLMLGTDNGMLCEPDLVREAAELSSIMISQGGDGSDAWKALSGVACKILYRARRMGKEESERYLTVIPQEGDETRKELALKPSFRVKFNRGGNKDVIQQDPGAHGRKRIHEASDQAGCRACQDERRRAHRTLRP